ELQQVALPSDLGAAATADEKAERAAAVKSANERNELCREAERQAAFWLVQCIETNDEALSVWDGLTDSEQKSGSVIWAKLKAHFTEQSGAATVKALKRFTEFALPAEDVPPIVIRASFNTIRRQMISLGCRQNDATELSTLLSALSQSNRWQSFARRCVETRLTTTDAVFDAMKEAWTPPEPLHALPAYSAASGGGGGGGGGDCGDSGNGGGSGRGSRGGFHEGRRDHTHPAFSAAAYSGGGRGGGSGRGRSRRGPRWGPGTPYQTAEEYWDSPDAYCRRCNVYGHGMMYCPAGPPKRLNDKNTTFGYSDPTVLVVSYALSAFSEIPLSGGGNASWVVDSGAQAHVTSSASGLSNVRPYRGLVRGIGGGTAAIIALGDLHGTVRNSVGARVHFSLKDVRIAPSAGFSLLSAHRLAAHNGIFELGDGRTGAARGLLRYPARNQTFPLRRLNDSVHVLDISLEIPGLH
ncbi:unnamed protein product, partial [Phaeothamnion confervicola]